LSRLAAILQANGVPAPRPAEQGLVVEAEGNLIRFVE
jgi:hypothetical protein